MRCRGMMTVSAIVCLDLTMEHGHNTYYVTSSYILWSRHHRYYGHIIIHMPRPHYGMPDLTAERQSPPQKSPLYTY